MATRGILIVSLLPPSTKHVTSAGHDSEVYPLTPFLLRSRPSAVAEEVVVFTPCGLGAGWLGSVRADVCRRLRCETDLLMSQSPPDPLSGRIFTIRGQRVVFDADLARLYGTTTKVFNQAIKRNAARFPKDFAFQATEEEAEFLRSQIVTLDGESVHGMGSQSVAASRVHDRRGKHRKYRPWVYGGRKISERGGPAALC